MNGKWKTKWRPIIVTLLVVRAHRSMWRTRLVVVGASSRIAQAGRTAAAGLLGRLGGRCGVVGGWVFGLPAVGSSGFPAAGAAPVGVDNRNVFFVGFKFHILSYNRSEVKDNPFPANANDYLAVFKTRFDINLTTSV